MPVWEPSPKGDNPEEVLRHRLLAVTWAGPSLRPVVHRDSRRGTGVDGSGGAVLRDRDQLLADSDEFIGQPRTLGAKHQTCTLRQLIGLQRHGAFEIVDADDGIAFGRQPVGEIRNRWVVLDMEIAVGDHRSTPVPAPTANDVHTRDVERVGGSHDGADIEVVLPVLDGNLQREPAGVEIGDDGRHRPIAVAVEHIAAIAVLEQIWVQPGVVGPRVRMRSGTRRPRGGGDLLLTQGASRRGQRAFEGVVPLAFTQGASKIVHRLTLGLLEYKEVAPLVRLGNSQSVTVPLPPVTPLEAAAGLIPMLLPSWMDPDELIRFFGPYALWGVAFIVFAECGLFAILPGDSLLFTVGLLTAAGVIPYNLVFVCAVLTIAAVLGNVSGYAIGRKIGPPLFKPRPGLAGKIFKQSYVVRTHAFFERYGNRALILARFVPIVRTFVTLVAGVGKMDFRHFITYTAIGGVLWACGVTIAGYFLGNIPFIKNNIDLVLILIVLASLMPMGIEYLMHRRRRKQESAAV
jgi:membrane-associated protein